MFMNRGLRTAEQIGIVHVKEIDWHFRVYLMLGEPAEIVERSSLFLNLANKVRAIAKDYLSEEFKYIRTGFILAHYGRRGVTHSIWHWADWEGTWEYFCQAWYCYGRSVDNMAPLDRIEPILCQHEIDIVTHEALLFRDIASRRVALDEIITEEHLE